MKGANIVGHGKYLGLLIKIIKSKQKSLGVLG
jgi:hypothetical protein